MSLLGNAARAIETAKYREGYEKNLLKFSEHMWEVVEPAIPFIQGWALQAIADHLQAVSEGHIRRLLINVPPGFTKSLMTDVFWPAWEWGPRDMPWLRYMCAAYSNHLTERDNMRCRNIVISERYKKLWGHRFDVSNEQFTKIKFANTKTGWKLATSVGGIGTGERADRVIIDDPNNPMEMESEAIRNTAIMWFTEIIPDRLNSQKDSAIVVIQQRTHEDDISGTAMSRDMGYTHLNIPMRYMPRPYVNGFDEFKQIKTFIDDDATLVDEEDVFWRDPRTDDDEIAWQERFPEEICQELERDKGPYAWAGQYQQMPAPRGGSIIKDHFWQVWEQDKYPTFEYIVASLDTAMTAKDTSDASALTVWGVFRESPILSTTRNMMGIEGNPKIMLLYAWTERLEFNELINKVIDTCIPSPAPVAHPRFPVDRILIENKANGASIGHELHRMFRGTGKVAIELIDPKQYGDKVARVHSVQHLFADNMIFAPNKAWADMVIRQCSLFPRGSKDDLVDSMSQALRYLRETGFALKRDEYKVDVEDDLLYKGQLLPLYNV